MLHHRWSSVAKSDSAVTVLPDGCRDILIVSKPGQPTIVRLTNWDTQPQNVEITAGTKFTGFRLKPGSSVAHHELAQITEDHLQVTELIESAVTPDEDIAAVISALAEPFSTVREVSKSAGVTIRTLQRQFKALALPQPEFWRLLGRARKAALALPNSTPLVEIAHTFGYSDQAHMTRDFVRWFGLPPTRLRCDQALLEQISQPALGNWTGEQISIR